MPKYTYKALNENGSKVSGEVEADSRELAAAIISERGYIPVDVTEGKKRSKGVEYSNLLVRLTPVKPVELILFTKQFRTMLRAGVSILNLLQIMEAQTENLKLKEVISSMAQDIKGGLSLHEAFKNYPNVFSPLYCSMIHAGESSGSLPDVLERLIYIIEHEHKVKSDIRAALMYPVVVVVALFTAFFILLYFVIPKFVRIFEKVGLNLPLPTKICLFLYNAMTQYWYFLIGGLAVSTLAVVFFLKTEQGQYVKDTILMKIPIVGHLFIKSAMSRFASIFAILQSSGVPVLDSLNILARTIGNAAITREFNRISELLSEGRGISSPLKAARYFPPMVINMVAIGEESGNLDEMLSEVAIHYDSEVEYSVKRLSDAIGPILIVSLAALVGFFALAIYLPMWDLTKMVR